MILIVDDDRSVTASLSLLLKQAGYAARAAGSPDEALALLSAEAFDLVIQDMNFSRRTSGEEGLALLARIKAARPTVPVILITAWGSIPLAVEGIKAGAADFVTKPWTNQQIVQTVETALGVARAQPAAQEPPPSRDDLDAQYDFSDLLGADVRMRRILHLVGRVSGTDASVLITGESGTGKELVADAIHRNSRRVAAPFVKVNLGGISTSLFESEMFGHVRGAFTDARSDRKGRFEVADGGTIFLDEIGDLDPASQVKLLRVLQDRTYEVLGSSQRREVNVRVISATNRNLPEMVGRGEFREDLLYRINLIAVHLPPLRERADDVPLLATRFLHGIAHLYRRDDLSLSREAVDWLRAQSWPGNVRQLRQWIERAVLVSRRDELEIVDFRAASAMESTEITDRLPPVGAMTLDELERAMIEKSLRLHNRNLTRVADSLGLSRAALYRRLEVRNPHVNQRTRFLVYVLAVHAMLAAAGIWLVADNGLLLLAVETVFTVSLGVGFSLVHRTVRDHELAGAGRRLIEEQEFTSRLRPVGHPAIDELIGVYNTLADRLRDERTRLQEQHHLLSHVLHVSPSAIVILDFDGKIGQANPAAERLFERPLADLVGKRLEEVQSTVATALSQNSTRGSHVLSVSGRRLKCQRGRFIDRGFAREFLLLEELTEELRHAERAAYERLIRVMAHEVNNSVAASNSLLHSSLAYGSQLDTCSRGDFEQAIGIVIGRTQELNQFMRRFADVFRLPAPARRSEALVPMLEATVLLTRARPEANGIRWVWDIESRDVDVDVDRGQLQQALLNILQNAVEATGPDGAVAIRLRTGTSPVLVIEDDGPGFSVEVRENLFTPFFSTKSNGQGIGLTLVHEILAAHGCEYTLERVGDRTRFTIWFVAGMRE